MWRLLESLLHQARIGQSRSSVVNPLQWTLVILITGILCFLLVHAPVWLIEIFGIALAVIILLLVFAFVFFMVTNPDALRSERYSLVKTAMEKKFVGDSLTGLREVIEVFEGSEVKSLTAGDGEKIEPDNNE